MKKNFVLLMVLLMSAVSAGAVDWQQVETNIPNFDLYVDRYSIKRVDNHDVVYAIRYNLHDGAMKIAHIKSDTTNNYIGVISSYDYDGSNYRPNVGLYGEAKAFMKPLRGESFLAFSHDYVLNGGKQIVINSETPKVVEEQKVEVATEEVKEEAQKVVEEQKPLEVVEAQKVVEEQKPLEVVETQKVASEEVEVKKEEVKTEVQQVVEEEKVAVKSEVEQNTESVDLDLERPTLRGEEVQQEENNIKFVSYEQKCNEIRRESMATNLKEYAYDTAKILSSNWEPPKSGRNTQAIVILNIGADGSLLNYKFAKKTGDMMTDRSIMSAVEQSVLYPEFSKLKKNANSVILQFVFDYKMFRKSVI